MKERKEKEKKRLPQLISSGLVIWLYFIMLGVFYFEKTNNSLVSHVLPVNPGAQEQVKLLIPSLHVPPFLHGPLAHSSMSFQ